MQFAIHIPHGRKGNGLAVKSLVSKSLVRFPSLSATQLRPRFWCNAIQTASPSSQRRFLDTFETYLDSLICQAMDRTANYIRSVDHYFELRRDTIGAKPSFAILEHYMNIPDDVMKHPVIMKLSELCVDMIVVGNDLYSYNKECVAYSYCPNS